MEDTNLWVEIICLSESAACKIVLVLCEQYRWIDQMWQNGIFEIQLNRIDRYPGLAYKMNIQGCFTSDDPPETQLKFSGIIYVFLGRRRNTHYSVHRNRVWRIQKNFAEHSYRSKENRIFSVVAVEHLVNADYYYSINCYWTECCVWHFGVMKLMFSIRLLISSSV